MLVNNCAKSIDGKEGKETFDFWQTLGLRTMGYLYASIQFNTTLALKTQGSLAQ